MTTITLIHRTANDSHTAAILAHAKVNVVDAVHVNCLDAVRRSGMAFVALANSNTLLSPSTSSKTIIIDGIAQLLILPTETIPTVLRGLQILIRQCANTKFTTIVLINHLELSTKTATQSLFSFPDVLDTLASQIYTIANANNSNSTREKDEARIWQDGWVIVDCFLLKSSGSGSYGRVRKGSVKERIGVKLDQGSKRTTSRLVSDLLHEVKPDPTVVVSGTIGNTVGSASSTQPQAAPSVPGIPSSRNDPTSNLSFNLKLTDEQLEMKNASVLPYVHTGEGIGNTSVVPTTATGGFIHYQADADDDSEGDPDDDLA
ncbi:UNVERIFIED_CONTAM: hypothetical protein HDU68_005546, partial [Siphonaria sp. JEL0065]